MNYVRIFTIIILFYVTKSFASCYDINNEFENDNLRGLKVTFSNTESSGDCNFPKQSSPYILLIPRDSAIKSTSEFNFTLSSQISSIHNATIKFYSGSDILAQIFIQNGAVTSDPNNILESVQDGQNKIYKISNILFQNISSIHFDSTAIDGNFVIDNMGYISDSVDIPIIVNKSYRIKYDQSETPDSYNALYRSKNIPHLNILKLPIIYYDFSKDIDNKGSLTCKDNDHISTNDLGYYFEQDNDKEIKFTGCCFANQYPAGYQWGPFITNEVINFDPGNDADLIFPTIGENEQVVIESSNKVVCANANMGAVSDGNLSYYFNSSACRLDFIGRCSGGGIIPDSDLINDCSSLTTGHPIDESQSGSIHYIACKSGCEYEDENNRLSYELKDNNVVEISGTVCQGITKRLSQWVSSVPLGLDGGIELQYIAGDNNGGALNCKSGYEEGSISYIFSNGNINFIDGSCSPISYELGTANNAALKTGLNTAYRVNYSEESTNPLGSEACEVGYSADNLSYSFNSNSNPDMNPELVITGNCVENRCLISEVNNNVLSNIINKQDSQISSEINCNDTDCGVNTQIIFDCNASSRYIASANPPKVTCQNDGTWLSSGECRLDGCSGSDLAALTGNTYSYTTSISNNYSYGYNVENISCNTSNRYFSGSGSPIITCTMNGWNISNECVLGCFPPTPNNIGGAPSNLRSIISNTAGTRRLSTDVYYRICQDGYVKSGGSDPYVHCHGASGWLFYGSDNCMDANYCGERSVANAPSISSGYLGKNVNINCNTGYSGIVNATCQSDRSWNISGNCQLQCHRNRAADTGNIGRSTVNLSLYPIYNDVNSSITYNSCSNGYIKSNNNHPSKTCQTNGYFTNSGSDNCVSKTGSATYTISNANNFNSSSLYGLFRGNNTINMTVRDGNWVGRVYLPEGMSDGQRFIFHRGSTFATTIHYNGGQSYSPSQGSSVSFIFNGSSNSWVRQ